MGDMIPNGKAPAVYTAIAAVQAQLAKVGISKDRKNAQQGYSFRGIDDVYEALAPVLSAHGLVVVPRMLKRDCVERLSKSGSAQFFVVVEAEFDFIGVADGSQHVARTFGEAQDSGDKATNKAMSAAYKYAAFMTFCIPTEGQNDADAVTPEPTEPKAPAGYDDWLIDLSAVAEEGVDRLKATWEKSPVALRSFLTTTNNAKWLDLKARAQKVSAPKTGKGEAA